MATIRVHLYDLITDEPATSIETRCAAHVKSRAKAKAPMEFKSDFHRYRLSGTEWDKKTGVFSGTMMWVRESELPSKVDELVETPLDVPDGGGIGEHASFALKPSTGTVAVQYNHHGPRQSALRQFLYEIGLDALTLSPRLTRATAARVEKAALLRRVEFSIRNPKSSDLRRLKAVGGAVGDVIDAITHTDGTSVRVIISMDQKRGSLGDRARQNIVALAEYVATGGAAVQTLKATVREAEEQEAQILDLLGARDSVEIIVRDAGTEIDHEACRARLRDLVSA